MTDKPRVEPSVSEPARCGASIGLGMCEKPKGHTDHHVSSQFGYDRACWWDKAEPVIAPQPTPEPQSECAYCADGNVPNLRRGRYVHNLTGAIARCTYIQPKVEITGVDWAKGPDYTVFSCPHCKQEIKIEQVAASGAVEKLHVHPDAVAHVHWDDPKGVEGVGQTAREWQQWQSETFPTDQALTEQYMKPWGWREAAWQFAEWLLKRKTLTLRAELQQAREQLQELQNDRDEGAGEDDLNGMQLAGRMNYRERTKTPIGLMNGEETAEMLTTLRAEILEQAENRLLRASALIAAYRRKRAADGMNGREWHASNHLLAENEVERAERELAKVMET